MMSMAKNTVKRIITMTGVTLAGGGLSSAFLFSSGSLFPRQSDAAHLDGVMAWLAEAQDACGGRGVSSQYRLYGGWDVPYPETSGYIIGTYLAYAARTGKDEFIERAIQLGDWECDIQMPDGGVRSHPEQTIKRVFNTGQVLLGWCALFERTGNQRYLDAARMAGDYLCGLQVEDGSWVRDTCCGARTYHSRVDWGLLRLDQLTGADKYAVAAEKNLRWVLSKQRNNGWFDACGFYSDDPITHVIEYTLGGLLEAHVTAPDRLGGLGIIDALIPAADNICRAVHDQPVRGISGMLPGSFDSDWKGNRKTSCLTGNAQLSYFLKRLAVVTGNNKYGETARIICDATSRTQNLGSPCAGIRGGMSGTYPLYDGYHANTFINWAAKFFADAVMMNDTNDNSFRVMA